MARQAYKDCLEQIRASIEVTLLGYVLYFWEQSPIVYRIIAVLLLVVRVVLGLLSVMKGHNHA